MAKLTEYPRATSFDEGDILIKDGVNGTKKILVSDASKFMGSEIIMINETAGENTKVVVTTTNEDVSLATTEDLQEVAEDIADIKTHIKVDGTFGELGWAGGYIASDGSEAAFAKACRTEYLWFDAYKVEITIKTGYKLNGHKYSATTVASHIDEIFSNETGTITLDNTNGYYYRFWIQTTNEAKITPADLPSDVLLIAEVSVTDATLTRPGKAADAKVTGDKVSELTDALNEKNTQTYNGVEPVILTFENGWVQSNGVYNPNTNRRISNVISTDGLVRLVNNTAYDTYLAYFSEYTDLSDFTLAAFDLVSANNSRAVRTTYPYVLVETSSVAPDGLYGLVLEKQSIIDYLSHENIENLTDSVYTNISGIPIVKNLSVGEHIFNYLFSPDIEYTIRNDSAQNSGDTRLIREDGTYESVGNVPAGSTLSFTPDEPFVKIRIYANAVGNFTITTEGITKALNRKSTELHDGINGNTISTETATSAGDVWVNYPFVIGNTYEISCESNRNTGRIFLFRADGTYKAIPGITANTTKTFVADEAYVALRVYLNEAGTITLSDKGIGYQIISGSIKQNAAFLAPMIESSVSKSGNYGYEHKIYPQLLVTTDIHADWDRLNRAFDYGDENDNSAFTVCLGDVVDNPTQFVDYDWSANVLEHSKPILPILGNHDVMTYTKNGTSHRMTNEELFAYFFDTDLQEHNGEVHDSDSLYWYKDVTKTYTDGDGSHTNILRIIGLNQFEFPPNEEGDRQQYIFYTQDQIDWLIDLLDNTPNNAYVMICCHSSPTKNATIQNNPWSAENVVSTNPTRPIYLTFYDNNSQGDPDMLMKIVDAWISGATVNLTNTQTLSGETVTITVNHTFNAHTNKFAGWLCGHVHYDAYAIKEGYTNQKIIALNCTTARDSQQAGDLGRALYGKAQDCITLVSYDWDSGKIRLARLGADMTIDGKVRQLVVI